MATGLSILQKSTRKRLVTTWFAVVLAWCHAAFCASAGEWMQVEQLNIAGKDVTAQGGYLDLDAPGGMTSATSIELAFALPAGNEAGIGKLRLVCRGAGSTEWPFPEQIFAWDANCSYDAATGKGIFRIPRFAIDRHSRYSFSVDASAVAADAPKEPPYQFHIYTYPSIPNVGMNALPFYVIEDQHKGGMLGFPTDVYTEMNRLVPPNSSLSFSFTPAREFWPGKEPIEPWLRIFLVELEATTEEAAFRRLHVRGDLPKGRETVLYDGPASKTQEGFMLEVIDTTQGNIFASPRNHLGAQHIWIRNPAPGKPNYQNANYLKPGAYYSLQFELAHGPYEGIRYEASRFGVRPDEGFQKGVEVAADYGAGNFVDWHGDWFNGHLYPTNNIPSAGWGQDFLLMKEARDKHPDLWRTYHYQYLSEDFSSMFNFLANIYRDRSTRSVTEARRQGNGDVVLTVKHISGAEYFHNPDSTTDTLASHPAVADEKEAIYKAGDLVFLQAKGQHLEGKVKEVRAEANELVLEIAGGTLWAVRPEGAPRAYPAILGAPGAEKTTISLPGDYAGTYLRHRNGRPYANWGILNFTFDFVINAMEMRASIERYGPYQFVGDAFTGNPTRAGWQIVSDCEYIMMRHMLRRYANKPLDTILHPIFGESNGYQQGGDRYIQLYDFYADGILRAYEEVMGVQGEDYKKIRIGLGGVMLPWNLEWMIRHTLSHALPAPLEAIFPADAPARAYIKSLPNMPLGSNPLYYFTGAPDASDRSDRGRYRAGKWDTNGCFLDDSGNSILRPDDWDKKGKLTAAAVERLLPGWRNARWLLENTRFGKGTPFRSVNVEGYGWSSEDLAKAVLFEKELLAQLDRNLKATAKDDPYVANYLQGVHCGMIQNALFNWAVTGIHPVGRPFQGTGYWPAYFADAMRRILASAAEQEPGIFNVGTFTFDTFLGPDGGNVGTPADTVSVPREALDWSKPKVQQVDLGNGYSLEIDAASETFEKDIRKLIWFVGMMTHRLAALPEQQVNGHVISGVVSKEWTGAPADVVSGNEAGDDKRFYVLLYDHYVPDIESQDEAEIPMKLRVRNLPAEAREAKVTVYRLDREHGSLFPVTESEAFRESRPKAGATAPAMPPAILEALRKTKGLQLDPRFEGNEARRSVTAGGLDLDLKLGANRCLFAVVDWN